MLKVFVLQFCKLTCWYVKVDILKNLYASFHRKDSTENLQI